MNVCHYHQAKEETLQTNPKKIQLDSYATYQGRVWRIFEYIFVLKSIRMSLEEEEDEEDAVCCLVEGVILNV